jgi:hypothetical protein
MYSIEIPASGGASINNDTEGFGWFTGFCTGVLPWRGPIIGFRASGINDLVIDSAFSTTRGFAGTALPAAAAGGAGGLLTCTSANILPTDSIAAASIAADAITAAKIATGAIDADAIADNAIDAGAIASNAITSAKIATGAITSSTFAAGAINAAAIAADAITDAKVASDVTIASVTGAVGSVTGAVGSVTGSVGSIATGGITTASFAAGAINAAAIASDAITDAKVASDVTIASVTGAVGSVTGAVGSVTGAVGSVTGNIGGNVVGSVGSVTAVSDKTGYRLSATGVDDVLDEVVEGSYTFRQFLRLFAAALGGELSGAATTTIVIRNASDSKTVITATVDSDGNRSAMSLDLT